MRERIRDLGRLEHMLEHIDRANFLCTFAAAKV